MTQNPDGSLSYTAPDGTAARVGIFDANYSAVFAIYDKQNAAKVSNALKLQLYNQNLAGAQAQVAKGVNVPAPTKPTMEAVDDQGNDTQVPFVPPLADLIPSTVVVTPGSGSIAATGPGVPLDYLHLCYQMLLALYHEKFPDAKLPG
jgi:hypothetical protein